MPRSVCSLLVVVASMHVFAQVPCPEPFREVEETIRKSIENGSCSALSVAVLQGGEITWAQGYGLADRERGIEATANTIYRLASISKPITATGLMLLVERGKVDLDAPANTYLGAGKLVAHVGSVDDMTIRRLANHTSGLPLHWSFYYDEAPIPSREETIRRYGFAAWEPGTHEQYSNLAFGILDHVIARVSGMSYRTFMEREVFDPLGMERTSDHVRAGFDRDAAVPYDKDVAGRFVRVSPYGFDHDGASAVVSSALDLMTFARLYIGKGRIGDVRLLQEETVVPMSTPVGSHAHAGIAWFPASWKGKQGEHVMITHSGGMPGVATRLQIYPEDGVALAVLANGSTPLVELTVRGINANLFGFPGASFRGPRDVPPFHPFPERVRGSWIGRLVHPDGNIEFSVRIDEKAPDEQLAIEHRYREDVHVTLGQTRKTPEAHFDGTQLVFDFDARLATSPSFHGIPNLRFELRLQGERLVGVCIANAEGYFSLSHWVELERE